jgi:hypothetical protein
MPEIMTASRKPAAPPGRAGRGGMGACGKGAGPSQRDGPVAPWGGATFDGDLLGGLGRVTGQADGQHAPLEAGLGLGFPDLARQGHQPRKRAIGPFDAADRMLMPRR